MPRDAETLARVRRALLALLAFGFTGMTAELLLTGHTEDFWQLVPVVLCLAGLGLASWSLRAATRAAPTRTVMILAIASGFIGVYLHYVAKAEFALERDATLAGVTLFKAALVEGTNPPLLAPGAMIVLGALGLIVASTRADTRSAPTRGDTGSLPTSEN